MFGFTLIEKDYLANLHKEIELQTLEQIELVDKLDEANKTIAKLQTHLREEQERTITKELLDRDLLYSKNVKQIAYAIFHQYAERAMDYHVIKKEEKTYQKVYNDYIQHLKNLIK